MGLEPVHLEEPDMVHETKLLTFWRALNDELRQRGARPVDLDVAEIFFTSGLWTVDEVADVLAMPAKRYADDFAAVFGGN